VLLAGSTPAASPKNRTPKAYDRSGHQPVITAARYSSQAEQFHIDLCLPRVA